MVQHNLTDKELESLLEAAEKEKPKAVKSTDNPEIDKFIVERGIKAGKKAIPNIIVYLEYYFWKQKNLISQRTFLNYLKTKFEVTKTEHGVGFMLDEKPFDLSSSGYFKARALARQEREERKSKKK